MVKSRWGLKQHAPACPCGVCKSKRKEHIASLRSKVGEANTDVRSIAASETSQTSQASQQAVLVPHDVSTESADLQRRSDLQPAETGNSDTENQQGSTHVNRAVDGSHEQSATTLKKSALKVLLCIVSIIKDHAYLHASSNCVSLQIQAQSIRPSGEANLLIVCFDHVVGAPSQFSCLVT